MSFAVPAELAARCFARLGVDAPTDVVGAGALLERMARALPVGSTAKLEAIDAGRVPPGADPAAVAVTWVDRPGLAWSCWAACTLYASLVRAGGVLDAAVVGVRRVDPATAPVDFHSVVVVADGDSRHLTDPYFGVGPIPSSGGDVLRAGLWAEAGATGRGVWHLTVGSCSNRSVLRYRSVTTPLDHGDVEAFCRVSVTHSGVANRRRAQVLTTDGALAAAVDRDGSTRLRRWRAAPGQVWGATCEIRDLGSWADAESALAAEAAGGGTATAGDR